MASLEKTYELARIGPELILLIWSCAILLVMVFIKDKPATRFVPCAFALAGIAFAAAVVRANGARWILAVGVAVHTVGMTGRGIAIGFFPLTNKMESFSTCALALALVGVAAWRPARTYTVPIFVAMGAAEWDHGPGTPLAFELTARSAYNGLILWRRPLPPLLRQLRTAWSQPGPVR